jgi:hypothetical protein
LRIGETDAFSDQKQLDFGASTCSKLSSAACAEQNHPREKIEEIAKPKNRVQLGSALHRTASL